MTASAPAAHHLTPSSTRFDGLGRTICQVARNGTDPAAHWFVTRSAYDIRGNVLEVVDRLGRKAFVYAYDLLNRPLRVDSIDAGLRTSVLDASGNLVESRASKGSLVIHVYDLLARPKQVWARDERAGLLMLREDITYGDEGVRTTAIAANALGRPIRHRDGAGALEFLRYDFRGNLVEKRRRVISDVALAAGWVANWSAANAEGALDPAGYLTSIRYDALNRAIEVRYPEDVNGHRARLQHTYNSAGAVEKLVLDGAVYVERIAYNARGQRTLTAYGNGLMTRHAYDTASFRLARLRTEGYAIVSSAPLRYTPVGEVLQDFAYAYDLAGNVVAIDERVNSCGVRNSVEGADRLLRRFEYDPLYRLTAATGRACANIGVPRTLSDDARCGFVTASPTATQGNAPDLTERYSENYRYDPAGNLEELSYSAPSGNWKRSFTTRATSNRLQDVTNAPTVHTFSHDANGNLILQNTERHYGIDYADQMASFRIQPSTGGPASVEARYLYGADGMRVKKWVRRGNTSIHDQSAVYINSTFEHHQWQEGGGVRSNNRLHVMDDRVRIAIARVGNIRGDDAGPPIQYHLGDHIGGSHVVVGGNTPAAHSIVNREEHFPYGETSFGSFARKCYRFSGKERDEESGLCYFGIRYYAPSLCRWASCDPKPSLTVSSLFAFVDCSPVTLVDNVGLSPSTPAAPGSNPTDPGGAPVSKLEKLLNQLTELENEVRNASERIADLTKEIEELQQAEESRKKGVDDWIEEAKKEKDQKKVRGLAKRSDQVAIEKAEEVDDLRKRLRDAEKARDKLVKKRDKALKAFEEEVARRRGPPSGPKALLSKVKQLGSKIVDTIGPKFKKLGADALDLGAIKKLGAYALDLGTKSVPIAGGTYTYLTTEGSAEWKGLNAVAGEIGIGPIDAQTAGEGLAFAAHMGVEQPESLVLLWALPAIPLGYPVYLSYNYLAME